MTLTEWELAEADGARFYDHPPYLPGPTPDMTAEEAQAYIRRQLWAQHEHDNADRQNADYAGSHPSEEHKHGV